MRPPGVSANLVSGTSATVRQSAEPRIVMLVPELEIPSGRVSRPLIPPPSRRSGIQDFGLACGVVRLRTCAQQHLPPLLKSDSEYVRGLWTPANTAIMKQSRSAAHLRLCTASSLMCRAWDSGAPSARAVPTTKMASGSPAPTPWVKRLGRLGAELSLRSPDTSLSSSTMDSKGELKWSVGGSCSNPSQAEAPK